MTVEVQILLINAALLVLAYGLIYPRLLPMRLGVFVLADLVLTGADLLLVWYVYAGQSLWFLGWTIGPVPFALITLMVMEFPIFHWFAGRHNLLP